MTDKIDLREFRTWLDDRIERGETHAASNKELTARFLEDRRTETVPNVSSEFNEMVNHLASQFCEIVHSHANPGTLQAFADDDLWVLPGEDPGSFRGPHVREVRALAKRILADRDFEIWPTFGIFCMAVAKGDQEMIYRWRKRCDEVYCPQSRIQFALEVFDPRADRDELRRRFPSYDAIRREIYSMMVTI